MSLESRKNRTKELVGLVLFVVSVHALVLALRCGEKVVFARVVVGLQWVDYYYIPFNPDAQVCEALPGLPHPTLFE